MRRLLGLGLALSLAAGAVVAWFVLARQAPLPDGVRGTLVYVSDRSGMDSLYLRRLPDGADRLLAATPEPAREPALSPDGTRVAFAMGGRIGLVAIASGDVRILTLGLERRDAAPAWSPDGRTLVVTSRKPGERNADLHLLSVPDGGLQPERRALTLTPLVDESEPVFGPEGGFIVFVREDNLVRLELADGRTRRLTGGFRKVHHPRFRPDGRLLCLWSQDKQFGLDVLDPDGKGRETLGTGTVAYRTLAPSPDGRFLAATFSYDLSFHPSDALKLRQTEEVHLLDARGRPLRALVRSWRHADHSPAWGR